LTFCGDTDVNDISKRFPFVELFPSILKRSQGAGGLFGFGKRFRSVAFHNCVIINGLGAAIRVKHILDTTIVSRSFKLAEYQNWLSDILNLGPRQEIVGVHTSEPGQGESIVVAGQFANMFSTHNLRETTIGEFLRSHPTILKQALGTKQFIYEPLFKWLDGPAGGDHAINPDLMIQRADGKWDIYDLKTSALSKNSITKGPRRRRRFIDYVEEGVAQLAHYEEYFQYAKNAEYAFDKYGVVVDKPNLVLVVGTFESVDPIAVKEASRRLRNISIIDYDSLLQLFLTHARGAMNDHAGEVRAR
jgi:hypothetical protein